MSFNFVTVRVDEEEGPRLIDGKVREPTLPASCVVGIRGIEADRSSRRHRALVRLSGCLALLLVLAGCGGEQMDADTPCREFLQAPGNEQNAAIARVADELGARNALTPLGRPNIDYLCSQNQDLTLGEAVRLTG